MINFVRGKMIQPTDIANFIINVVRPELKRRKISIQQLRVSPARLVELIGMIDRREHD